MYGYIYKTTNLINGKIYVGQHKVDDDKLDVKYYGSGLYLIRAIEKYGKENFSCEILEWCKDKEALNLSEKEWIKELNSQDKNIGYNIAYGGDGGYLGEDACKKISEAKLNHPPWNKGLSNIYSESTKEKMRQSKLNKASWNSGATNCYTQETLNKMYEAKQSKKVKCVETNEIFLSARDACIQMNLDVSKRKNINRCCNNYRKEAFNYHWEYVKAEENSEY